MILGTATSERSTGSSHHLAREVAQSWGAPLFNRPPPLNDWKMCDHEKLSAAYQFTPYRLDARKKVLLITHLQRPHGCIWTIANHLTADAEYTFAFIFPNPAGTYDRFIFRLMGKTNNHIDCKSYKAPWPSPPAAESTVRVSFITRGMETWRYQPGSHSGRVRTRKPPSRRTLKILITPTIPSVPAVTPWILKTG